MTDFSPNRYRGAFRLIGPPGTGKTHWLREQVKAISEHNSILRRANSVMLCSLTKTAAKEIIRPREGQNELPISKSAVGTLHSHCFHALGKPDLAEVKIDDWNKRNPDLTIGGGSAPDVDEPSSEWNPRGEGDKLYSAMNLYRARMTPREAWPVNVQNFARLWDEWKDGAKCLDFTDIVEICYRDLPTAPGEPRQIMADEGQDLSALEYALVRKWGAKADAEFIAGDPWQALYVWRGAHPELFFDPAIPEDHRKILSQSYRIPARVHEAAIRWATNLSDYREISYRPRSEEGSVYRAPATWRQPESAIKGALKHLESGRSVMMMASCSFQLNPLLEVLRRSGVPFSNPWRVKRGDWNPIRWQAEGSSAARVRDFLRCDWQATGTVPVNPWTMKQFGNWVSLLKSKGVLARGIKKEIKFEVTNCPDDEVTREDLMRFFSPETFADLDVLIGRSRESSPVSTDMLVAWLRSNLLTAKKKPVRFALTIAEKFGPKALIDPPNLYVGTIHSFKGGEADVAYIFPDLSAGSAAEWAARGKSRDNVVRMFYVALTRAKSRVVVCQPCGGTPLNILF